MIAPDDLTILLLEELGDQAYEFYTACHSALGLDREASKRVCAAGARIAHLLGITAGVAIVDPPSEPLVELFEADKEETLDMDPEDR